MDHTTERDQPGISRDRSAPTREEQFFRLAFRASPTGTLVVDPEGRIVIANPSVEELFGYPSGQLAGVNVEILVPKLLREGHPALRAAFLATPAARPMGRGRDLYGLRKDGSEVPIEVGLNPLVVPDGTFVIATIIDITERKSAAQRLAATRDQQERVERKYRSIFENAVVGVFQTTPSGHYLEVNDAMARMLGYASPSEILSAVHDIAHSLYVDPSRRTEFMRLLHANGSVTGFEAEHLRADRRKVWLALSAREVRDADGSVAFYEGFAEDVTARKSAQAHVARLLRLHAAAADLGQRALRLDSGDTLPEDCVRAVATALEVDFCRFKVRGRDGGLSLRAAAGWVSGRVVSGATQPGGRPWGSAPTSPRYELVSQSTSDADLAMLANEQNTGGSALSVTIPIDSGPYGEIGIQTRGHREFTKDERDFLQTAASILGVEIERQRSYARLQRLVREHRALSECNQMLIRAENEPEWLQQVCEIIVGEAGYRMCWVGYAEHDAARTVRPVARAGVDQGYVDRAQITWADEPQGRGPAGTAIRTGKVVIVRDIASDAAIAIWRDQALRHGYVGVIGLPLSVGNDIIGVLMIYAGEADRFDGDEVTLLTELADDLAYGIATLRARRVHAKAQEDLRVLNSELEQRVLDRTRELVGARAREAETGFRIQQTLLLDTPPREAPGLRVAAFTLPSQQISGDSYGFLAHPDTQCLDVFIADVMGKGIPAALLSAAVKSRFPEAMWHLMATTPAGRLPEPREVVTAAHSQIVRELEQLESIVTLLYARINRPEQRLEFVDCGHTGIIHLKGRERTCSLLHGTNVPFGVIDGELFGQESVSFESNDTFLLFSDGVTEAHNTEGELFGADRLIECVTRNATLEPDALIAAVRDATLAFSDGRPLRDDVTCVAVKVVDYDSPVAHAELELTSDLSELRRARDFVGRFCRDPASPFLDTCALAQLALAVDEALANIIKHAYAGRSDQRVHLTAEACLKRVTVRLSHTGRPFAAGEVIPPALDGSRESGFGVYLIERLVHAVRYHRDELGRHCIELSQLREPA